MTKIEMGRVYRTRDGREVRIYAVDGSGSVPIHGAIKNSYGWEPYQWIKDGRSYLTNGPEDLIEVRPRIKREVWVNVYPGGVLNMRYTRADADDDATSDRIACVKLTIDVEEGEGL